MKDKKFKYPLIEANMKTKDVIAYCKKIGMLNKLYERFTRLGCWLCPKQSERSLFSLWKYYPDFWDELKKLEKDSPHGFKIKSLAEYEKMFKWRTKQTTLFDLEDEGYCQNNDCRSSFGILPTQK